MIIPTFRNSVDNIGSDGGEPAKIIAFGPDIPAKHSSSDNVSMMMGECSGIHPIAHRTKRDNDASSPPPAQTCLYVAGEHNSDNANLESNRIRELLVAGGGGGGVGISKDRLLELLTDTYSPSSIALAALVRTAASARSLEYAALDAVDAAVSKTADSDGIFNTISAGISRLRNGPPMSKVLKNLALHRERYIFDISVKLVENFDGMYDLDSKVAPFIESFRFELMSTVLDELTHLRSGCDSVIHGMHLSFLGTSISPIPRIGIDSRYVSGGACRM
jgi:hypothetical protein